MEGKRSCVNSDGRFARRWTRTVHRLVSTSWRGTGKTERLHCDGGKRDECLWRGEVRSRREIASQLAHAANESSFTRIPPPLAGARSPGPSFPRPYRD